jgi:hypothetical protein
VVLLPVGGIGPAEAEQRLLRHAKLEIVGCHFQREDGDIDVEEEIKVHVNDLKLDRLVASRKRQAHLGHVVAAHDPNWALPVAAPDRLAQALPVQEALYRRQESDKLVVVPFLEFCRIAKLVIDFPPRAMATRFRQVFPVVLK